MTNENYIFTLQNKTIIMETTEREMSVDEYARWNRCTRSWVHTILKRKDGRINYKRIGNVFIILPGSERIKGGVAVS